VRGATTARAAAAILPGVTGTGRRDGSAARTAVVVTGVVLTVLTATACRSAERVALPPPRTVEVLPDPGAPPQPAAARPVPTTTTAPTTTTSMPGSVLYQVRPGDTLTGIAADLGVSYAVLLQLNPLRNPGVLSVGQVLVVPGPTSPTAGDGSGAGQASTSVPVTGSTLPAATKTG